jgi:outer membrane lipoprotein-sorting protein
VRSFSCELVLFFSLVIIHAISGEFALLHAADTNALLATWINAQTNLQTWSADLTQTRKLKSLIQPLTATGQVWFAAPKRFRWEIGSPAQTIAVRQPDQMLVIYPRLKRIEKYPLAGDRAGPWKDALALLEAGFPRSRNELESRFRIISLRVANDACEVALQPKTVAGRRLISEIKIAFSLNDFILRSTELQFGDGSIMRNDFFNQKTNLLIAADLFDPPLGEGYSIVEPMKK